MIDACLEKMTIKLMGIKYVVDLVKASNVMK